MVSVGDDTQLNSKLFYLGGADGQYQLKGSLHELSCQSALCIWNDIPIELNAPRIFGVALVIPEILDCQSHGGDIPNPNDHTILFSSSISTSLSEGNMYMILFTHGTNLDCLDGI